MNLKKTIPTPALLSILTLILLTAFPAPALSHAVGVFAYVEGDIVRTVGKFSDGKPARDREILVMDAENGEEYLRGRTDQQGEFCFPIPEKAQKGGHGLRIRIKAGLGHQDEWLLEASEIAD